METFDFLASGAFWAQTAISAGITLAIVFASAGAASRAIRTDLQHHAENLARDHRAIKETALGEQKLITMLFDNMKQQTEEASKRDQELRRLREENLRLMMTGGGAVDDDEL